MRFRVPRGWFAQLAVWLAVTIGLAAVLTVAVVQRGSNQRSTSAHASVPTPAPTDSPSPSTTPQPPSPTAAPTPAPTPTPSATPTPARASAAIGSADLTFTGAIAGAMHDATVSCGQHIPQGDGGYMGVTGTVDGKPHIVQIWSRGPAPGTPLYIEVWNGSSPGSGDIAFRADTSGMTRFDWAGGVTLDMDLVAFSGSGPGIHVSGRIVCGPSYTSGSAP